MIGDRRIHTQLHVNIIPREYYALSPASHAEPSLCPLVEKSRNMASPSRVAVLLNNWGEV